MRKVAFFVMVLAIVASVGVIFDSLSAASGAVALPEADSVEVGGSMSVYQTTITPTVPISYTPSPTYTLISSGRKKSQWEQWVFKASLSAELGYEPNEYAHPPERVEGGWSMRDIWNQETFIGDSVPAGGGDTAFVIQRKGTEGYTVTIHENALVGILIAPRVDLEDYQGYWFSYWPGGNEFVTCQPDEYGADELDEIGCAWPAMYVKLYVDYQGAVSSGGPDAEYCQRLLECDNRDRNYLLPDGTVVVWETSCPTAVVEEVVPTPVPPPTADLSPTPEPTKALPEAEKRGYFTLTGPTGDLEVRIEPSGWGTLKVAGQAEFPLAGCHGIDAQRLKDALANLEDSQTVTIVLWEGYVWKAIGEHMLILWEVCTDWRPPEE